MARIDLRSVTVRFGDVTAIDRVHLGIADGEFVTVIGSSGAGKSTLLRVVAGLDPVSSGSVWLDDDDVTSLAPGVRDLAMVFQYPHLIPGRTVRRNVSFPLEVRRATIGEIRERVGAEARALHIEALLERSPDQLSMGESQLVQIARALVRVPSALLLDEPLARLDPQLRERMRRELRLLQRGYGVTTLLTTNDPVEAVSMGDRLVVLDGGSVVQDGAPLEVYRNPRSLLVAQLTGPLDIIEVDPGRIVDGVRPDGARLSFDAASGARLI